MVSFIAVRISQKESSLSFIFYSIHLHLATSLMEFLWTIHWKSLAFTFFFIGQIFIVIYLVGRIFLFCSLSLLFPAISRVRISIMEVNLQIDYYRFDSAAQLNSNRKKHVKKKKRSKFVAQNPSAIGLRVSYLSLFVYVFNIVGVTVVEAQR